MENLEPYYAKKEPTQVEGYRVLCANKIPPNIDGQCHAVRSTPIYEWIAQAGDPIPRDPGIAAGGEHVWIKRLHPSGKLKIYVPADGNGPLSDEVLSEKYGPAQRSFLREEDPILSKIPAGRSLGVRLPYRDKFVPILHEAIQGPTVILNTRGEGQHQFFEKGDSLKYEENQWVGVSKAEMDTGWEVVTLGPPKITR